MTGQFQLNEDQLAIQEMAQRFTADNITPFAAEWDEKAHFPREVIQKTGEQLGIVEKRSVELGELAENATVEILKGLEAGETILARGVHRIEPGTEVRLLD